MAAGDYVRRPTHRSSPMARKLLAEFIGTFFLVLTIGLAVAGAPAGFAPLAIGSVLMVLVYAGGHISGAHYNPAVTLGLWMRGATPAREVGPYMGAQVVGAFVAAHVIPLVTGEALAVAPAADASLGVVFLLELLFTFALVYVVLNVATAKANAGNSYFGLAIGFTVLAGAYAAGPVSGGAFNPAVALGPILVETMAGEGRTLGGLWVYLVATFAGGALAALAFRFLSPGDVTS